MTGGQRIPSRRELTELLADVSLFSRCSRRERATVARHMETASLPAGTTLVEEGEEGDAFFVILEGAASVRKGERVLAEVGPGASFGELALLDGEPRSASVVATVDSSVAVLGVRMFRTLLREFPEMALELMAGLAGDVRRAREEVEETQRSAGRTAGSAERSRPGEATTRDRTE
jgi:CRP-like cAMP-binding protein